MKFPSIFSNFKVNIFKTKTVPTDVSSTFKGVVLDDVKLEVSKEKVDQYVKAQNTDLANGIKLSSEETGKSPEEVEQIANSATSGQIQELNQNLEKLIKKLTKNTNTNQVKSILKTTGIITSVTVSSGALLYIILGVASSKTDRINNTIFKVNSIKKNGKNTAILKYSPAEKLCISHKIKQITNTVPSVPSIENKEFKITKNISIDEIEFEYTDPLSQEITSGDVRFRAEIKDQLECTLGDLKDSFNNTLNILPYVLLGAGIIILLIIIQKFKSQRSTK